MKKLGLFIGFVLAINGLMFSQVSVTTDNSLPDNSAMLDLKATNRGLLIPRISTAARNLIPAPATGLLIYNTTTNKFNYFNGSYWFQLETTFISSAIGTLSVGGGVSISASPGLQPENSAMLDVNNPTRGILIPGTTPNLITTPATGLIIYNTATNLLNYYNGAQWVTLCSISTGIGGAGGSQTAIGVAIKADNTGPHQSAMLDISAVGKGVLIPRLTTAQRNVILPVTGLVIYNVTLNGIEFYNGTGWHQLTTNLLSSPAEEIHVPAQTQIIWNWNVVAGATGYKWNTTNNYATATDVGAILTKTETGLACNTPFTRYIWAYNVCGVSTATSLTQTTTACDFFCGDSITVHHITGIVAPVNKTVTYQTVANVAGEPTKCWIASNLGADHQATTVNDATENSAGWFWQFNRKQGYMHSAGARTPNTTWITPVNEISDWLTANDPCALELGSTWRIPTHAEWENINDDAGWTNWNGPWNTPLKLHAAGILANSNGLLTSSGVAGAYWSGTHGYPDQGWSFGFTIGESNTYIKNKASGLSLRCLKEAGASSTLSSVSTNAVYNLGLTAANTGGYVVSDGGTTVISRGVCWSTSPNPTITGNHTTDGSGTGMFVSNLTGLNPNTLYHLRAYATNSLGTAYGNDMSFSTLHSSPCDSITINHAAGNVAPVSKTVTYHTVIHVPGELYKCWIASNLGADHQANGVDDATEASAGWYWQFNRKQGFKHDGTIRTPDVTWITMINENLEWEVANDPCALELGSGWRIPTYIEWSNVKANGGWTNWNGTWNSALKLHVAGYLYYTTGSLAGRGITGYYWSIINQYSNTSAVAFAFNSSTIAIGGLNKANGYPLRCLHEGSATPSIPIVTTKAISAFGTDTATTGGIVGNSGGETVIARGVCWSTSPNPTTIGSHTANGAGIGAFISKLTGLTENVIYYVRAYAINSVGTAYGNQVVLRTLSYSNCGTLAINHVAGAVAPVSKTVLYGTITNVPGELSKCWITSNLGADFPAPTVNDTNETSAGWYWQFNRKQGYKHDGIIRTPNTTWNSTYTEILEWQPANDPCKLLLGGGWRIPTFIELNNVHSSGGWTDWNGPWASPLKLHAAGNLGDWGGALIDRGEYGYYRSNKQRSITATAYAVGFDYNHSQMGSSGKSSGQSLRCLSESENSTFLPTITTTAVSGITQITAGSGGNVTSAGSAAVTARGLCWSTSPNSTIANTHTSNGSGAGSFSASITGLTQGTQYYVRAYATNNFGTGYGSELSFITLPTSVCSGVSYSGKSYNAVQIGTQCWFKENLNVGVRINGSQDQNATNAAMEKWCFNDLESNCDIYGGLYQWGEMMQGSTSPGAQGICPAGWHLPTDDEWCVMEQFLDAASDCGMITGLGSFVGGTLKETGFTHWFSPNAGATNLTGFTGLGGGYGYNDDLNHGYFQVLKYEGRFWSSSFVVGTAPICRVLNNDDETMWRSSDFSNGYSARCLRNSNFVSTMPTVTTTPISNIAISTATGGGNVASDGGTTVTASGVCWSVSTNPTIAGSHTSDGSGTGVFVSSLTGLTGNTLYYVRAYAINIVGISYGNELTFTTLSMPTVTTSAVTNIAQTTATGGGNVTSAGGGVVTERGVCWGTSVNPGITGSHTTDGSGTGGFVSNLTGLTANTIYYIRAYATSSAGTAYGNELSFTTLTLPTVATTAITNIAPTTATGGGNVTFAGGATVTARGVCWSNAPNPVITGNHTTDGSGTGVFTSSLTGLAANTLYYVRAYATNSVGTAYGSQVSFTTLSVSTCGPAVTYEGKTYATVLLGTQCWFKQNLNVGTRINGSQNQTNNSVKEKYCYADLESNCDIYGGLYQWDEMMQYVTTPATQGICPPGWHIPTDAEFTVLTTFLGGLNTAGGLMKTAGTIEGGSGLWYSPNAGATNESGFAALPGGYRHMTGAGIYNLGMGCEFWTSTEFTPSALFRGIGYTGAAATASNSSKAYGYGVRCVQAAGSSTFAPLVTTVSVSNIAQNTVSSGGNVISGGGAFVTARGVCWSISANPTVAGSHTTDGTGTGAFISTIAGLSANTPY